MKMLTLLLTVLLSATLSAQEKGPWRAENTTAKSITGDLYFTDSKLSINFISFTIAQIRTLDPTEALALFDIDTPGAGNLYRLDIPADKRFLRKNSICGSEPTQWAITWVTGKSLHLAFFTEPSIPTLTIEALNNSPRRCGTFIYTR